MATLATVDVAVGHGHQPQIFFGCRFAPRRKFGNGTEGGGFGHLPTGVGVHLRIHHQHVDVATAGQYVVKATVADVVGPAVTADDPHALFNQVIGQGVEVLQLQLQGTVPVAQVAKPALDLSLELQDFLPLLKDVGFVGLLVVEDLHRQVAVELGA